MKPRLFRTAAAYLAFLARLRPGAYHTIVLHDGACSPSRCTCQPWYVVEDGTAENVLAGAEGERAWRKSVSS
jgi:hypothetical protein